MTSSVPANSEPPLAATLEADRDAIEGCLQRLELPTRVGAAARYCLTSGGKRLRPLLSSVILRAFGVDPRPFVEVVAMVELVHAGSLLHDDVIDASDTRRGRTAAHGVFGAHTAILAGDLLLSTGFARIACGAPRHLLVRLTEVVCELGDGEALERERLRDVTIDLEHARRVNRMKTSALFGYAAEAGAILADAGPAGRAAAFAYGLALGDAFQTMDDLLDWEGDPQAVGKPLGRDLADGLVTVPVAIGLGRDTSLGDELRGFWDTADRDDERAARLRRIAERLAGVGAFAATRALGDDDAIRAVRALAELPAGPWRDCLADAARASVERDR